MDADIFRFSDLGEGVGFLKALLCLVVSFGLSIIVAKAYQKSYKGVAYSPSFMQTLVLCTMVIAAVMLIIGSNIARAFSLVGALSIIRFRNAVKDPRDVAFIFLAMGVGMACGSGFYSIAVLLTVVACAAIVSLSAFGFGTQNTMERLLRVQAPATKNFEHLFDDVLQKFTNSFHLLSVESAKMGTEMELLFSIRVSKSFKAEPLIEALSALNDRLRIQILGTTHVVDL